MSMFATMFFGVLDPETGLMVYINGGHEPLYLIDQSGRIKQTLKSTGPAVGMMENMPFRIEQVQFEPGDVLIGYTDGVPEGKDPDGHLFTSPRLIELIENEAPGSAQKLMDRINTTLFKHIDDAPQFDDITMIAVQCLSLVPPKPQVQPNSMEPLTVSGILNSLGEISQYVMNAAKSAGLEKKTSYQLRLAVDEIATNIILHGYEEAGLQGNVKVMAHIDDHHLTITVEDEGVPYDPTQKAPQDDLDLPLEERQIGGLGVYLAMEGVDQFSYERVDYKNRNIFIMNRPQS
jgi:anti-sigma regulatory factor (Ser/Thr protein kinase)